VKLKKVLREPKAREQEETRNHDKYLIVGLGNPGIKYTDTRHNLGFKAVDLFCHELHLHLSDQRFQALSTATIYHGKMVVVACPQTYMNRSGLAVRYLVEHHGPEISNVLVVHDDIDIEAGRIRIVRGGGAGGHRGVESIISDLGTNRFNRVKVGIGRPLAGESIEEFVLSPLDSEQRKTIEDVLGIVVKAIETFILDGLDVAMNRYNAVIITEKEVENSCKG
jgi:PTH1 family peptidyl-tRNA hydrolase